MLAVNRCFAAACGRAAAQRSTARSSSSIRTMLSVAIRREDKSIWERRAPMTPADVGRLKGLGVPVAVQPSPNRVYPDDAYAKAGAEITEDISKSDVILAIKEVPISKLIPDKTYMLFSHTHKGQSHNMPLLQSFLDKKIRAIDYELLTDDNTGNRTVLFGKHAGYSGMIDTLHGFGHKLLGLGFGTPFLHIAMAHGYPSLGEAKAAISRAGDEIRRHGTPKELGPIIFVFTGKGNVTTGALDVFKSLPHEYVEVESLERLRHSKDFDNRKIYFTQVSADQYAKHLDGKEFNRDEFYNHPERYRSCFHDKIAPFATVIMNGIYWDPKYPRLLTLEQIKNLSAKKNLRLLFLGDISCDIKGSFEFMNRATKVDQPFFSFDPITGAYSEGVYGKSVSILSIDNLPTELPKEATDHFSHALFPYVEKLVQGKFDSKALERATITANGSLMPSFAHLKSHLATSQDRQKSHRILLLGSGLVAAPLVDHLLKSPKNHLTIASKIRAEAVSLIKGRDNASAVDLDVENKENLGRLIHGNDIVISLVPAPLHPVVAEACIQQRKSMVTASYISPALRSLHEKAKSAGITLMNEIGLDPGIDHLTAMKTIDEAKQHGAKVVSFVSWCGGLPAPESSNNPLGYKFSWSPKAVLTACLNSAKYRRDGEIVDIPGTALLKSAMDVDIGFPGFHLEGIPNRDSLIYEEPYGLTHAATLFRGTLRYKGYAQLMDAFKEIGLFDSVRQSISNDISWASLMKILMQTPSKSKSDFKNALREKLSLSWAETEVVFEKLNWFDIFSDDVAVPKADSVIDAFCSSLQRKLAYSPGERDLVLMHHEFVMENPSGSKEKRLSTLISYGEPYGDTAMARTVGIPAAIATELILDGTIDRKGVIAPTTPDVYHPILNKLIAEGIHFDEKVVGYN